MGDNGISLADIHSERQWVAWRNEMRNGTLTKIPFCTPIRQAKSSNRTTWITHDQAAAVAKVIVNGLDGGVGIMLGPCEKESHWIAGIDLDACRDKATGAIEPWATAVIERFGSYSEVSPSENGIKTFVLVAPDDVPMLRELMGTTHGRMWKRKGGDHPPAIELYISNRYFAVTEQHLEGSPATLRSVPLDDLRWLINDAAPAFRGKKAKGKGTSTDQSRSAAAFRLGRKLRRQGKSFEEMVEALHADPATAAWAEEKGEPNDQRELRRIWDHVEPADSLRLTQDRAALAFTTQFADRLRFCQHSGRWHEWIGRHWRREETKLAFDLARGICRELGAGPALLTASAIAGVERLAQASRTLAVTSEIWDRDPYLLGTPGGTVDLRTGLLRPALQSDYISRLTAVAPSETADCPLWLAFLDQATCGRPDEVNFLKRWFGYGLTGVTIEHKLFFGWGPGGNGKGTLLNTVSAIMADYAVTAAMDSFVVTRFERHTTDMAMLAGARLVTTTEVEEGQTWAQAKVNMLTGGDPVTARFMRRDNVTYVPQFKLAITGNNRPKLNNVDDAARRRIILMAFTNKPAKPDLALKDRLIAEWPGILRWLIEGCLEWQAHGLNPPKSVQVTTKEYFETQDCLGRWIEECCILDLELQTGPGLALKSFQGWCVQNGEASIDSRRFRGLIEKTAGLHPMKTAGCQVIRGLGLKSTNTASKAGEDDEIFR